MNQKILENIRAKYGGVGSWAIWNPNKTSNVEVIDENLSDLHSRIVMVGLNISAPLTVLWSNFHIGRNDRKLSHAFNLAPYRGAYMTDLIKGEVEVKSSTLMRRIRSGEIEMKRHVADFMQEMQDVGADETTLFILFGGDVSRLFRSYFGKHYPKNVSVQHYAVYGSAKTWTTSTLSAIAGHQ